MDSPRRILKYLGEHPFRSVGLALIIPFFVALGVAHSLTLFAIENIEGVQYGHGGDLSSAVSAPLDSPLDIQFDRIIDVDLNIWEGYRIGILSREHDILLVLFKPESGFFANMELVESYYFTNADNVRHVHYGTDVLIVSYSSAHGTGLGEHRERWYDADGLILLLDYPVQGQYTQTIGSHGLSYTGTVELGDASPRPQTVAIRYELERYIVRQDENEVTATESFSAVYRWRKFPGGGEFYFDETQSTVSEDRLSNLLELDR